MGPPDIGAATTGRSLPSSSSRFVTRSTVGQARHVARLLVVHHSPTHSVQRADRRRHRRRERRRDRGGRGRGPPGARGDGGRRTGRRRLSARHAGELRLHERRAQALLRHHLPGGRWRAQRRRLGQRRDRRQEAVRALGARPLRHDRRGAVGALDRPGAALDPGGRGAGGARRRDETRRRTRRTSWAGRWRRCSAADHGASWPSSCSATRSNGSMLCSARAITTAPSLDAIRVAA